MVPVPRAKRILVVEDQADNRTLVVKVLRRAGLETIEADRAEELGAILAREEPDLILIDIELPGQNGYEAVQELRANPRTASIPVIALTAYAMQEDRERCLRAGCTDYLSKPLDIALLVETVERHLRAASAPHAEEP